MFSVACVIQNQIEIKKSIFISFLAPISESETLFSSLKSEHKKATHIIIAKRYFDNGLLFEYASDDNEPRNTAGAPTLSVLRGYDLVNVVYFCVRYFGGIKLGVGGLIKAYSTACSQNIALNKSNLIEFRKLEKIKVFLRYSNLNKIEYEAKNLNISLVKKEFLNDGVNLILEGEKPDLLILDEIIQNIKYCN